MARTPSMARTARSPDIHGAQHVEDLCDNDLQGADAVDGAYGDGGQARGGQ